MTHTPPPTYVEFARAIRALGDLKAAAKFIQDDHLFIFVDLMSASLTQVALMSFPEVHQDTADRASSFQGEPGRLEAPPEASGRQDATGAALTPPTRMECPR